MFFLPPSSVFFIGSLQPYFIKYLDTETLVSENLIFRSARFPGSTPQVSPSFQIHMEIQKLIKNSDTTIPIAFITVNCFTCTKNLCIINSEVSALNLPPDRITVFSASRYIKIKQLSTFCVGVKQILF